MEFTTHTVRSADGTTIGYRKAGAGKGLIICHGAGRISQNYIKLAAALADTYCVYIPDRRGRGLSGPEGSSYGMKEAKEDLIAVMDASSAEFIFGHSAGALIALEAMPDKPLQKIALYEPPVSFHGSVPTGWLPDFETALAQKKFKRALALSLKGLKVNEAINRMPFGVLIVLLSGLAMLEGEKEKGTRMFDLLHTLPADVRMLQETDNTFDRLSSLTTSISLMHGTESPAYFREGLEKLQGILQQASLKPFQGMDHYSPEQKTTELAAFLKTFFQ